MTRRLAAVAFALVVAGVPSALRATAAQPADAPDLMIVDGDVGRAGGRLVVAARAEPKTFNPIAALDVPSRDVIWRMHADLIHINRETQRTEPALARSWTVSPDGLHYVLQLRRGVRFSDGHGIAISSDKANPIAYVTFGTYHYGPDRFSASGGLAVINVNTRSVKSIPLFSLPGPVALSQDGTLAFASIQYIWTETFYGAGFLPTEWVASVDTTTSLVSWTSLGGGTGVVYTGAGRAVTPDRSAAFVAVRNMKGVAIIDATTGLLRPEQILLDGSPTGVAFVPESAAPASTPKIVAVDDAPAALFASGSSEPAIADVLANDTLGGKKAAAGVNVQLIPPGSFPTGVSLDTGTGAVWVHADAAPGLKSFGYQICEMGRPDNCASAKVSLNVRAPYAITAGDDSGSSTPGGVAITNVIANDADALALTSRKLVRIAVESTGIELHHAHQPCRTFPGVGLAHAEVERALHNGGPQPIGGLQEMPIHPRGA